MLPKVNSKENKRSYQKIFGGLDRRQVISDISLSDMMNMSCDNYPALSPCKQNKHIDDINSATAICSPEYSERELSSFTGISDNHFIYKGRTIEGELSSGEKSIADFNGKICIFPDKVYYNYIPDSVTGEVSTALTPMEKSLSVANSRFYSSQDNVTGEYDSYMTSSGVDFTDYFSVGDSIVISDCAKSENNVIFVQSRKQSVSEDAIVSAVITKLTSTRIDFQLYKKNGQQTGFKSATETDAITLKLAIPDMNHICVHNNRLWGTASSGEYIYASKLGDLTSFNSFQGLSDDSWYAYIATGGRFTGICSFRTAVVAFKENCIHHIYGDSPRNFAIPKHTVGGCIDGRSICEIQGVLYYLSAKGFYAYNGGEPYDISAPLNREYSSCIGETDGKHYYVSACSEDNVCDFMVYTPEYNLWTQRDSTNFTDMCSYNGKVYGLTENEMVMVNCGEIADTWYASTKAFTYDHFDLKGIYEIYIRASVSSSAHIRVMISYNEETYTECGCITGNNKLSAYRIPVRFKQCDNFKIKLLGSGNAVIHSIEIINYKGGRIYG